MGLIEQMELCLLQKRFYLIAAYRKLNSARDNKQYDYGSTKYNQKPL